MCLANKRQLFKYEILTYRFKSRKKNLVNIIYSCTVSYLPISVLRACLSYRIKAIIKAALLNKRQVLLKILIKNGRLWTFYPLIFCMGLSNTDELDVPYFRHKRRFCDSVNSSNSMTGWTLI